MTRREFTRDMVLLAAAAALRWPNRARAADAALPLTVDTHAHIFQRGLKLAPVHRYVPDYDATLGDYLKQLNQHQITKGVLIQPSFLGTDNSYLVEALAEQRDRLRGIAVVEPEIPGENLAELASQGIVGIRLNLIGEKIPELKSAKWQAFLKKLVELNWQVEIQREARDLPQVIDPLLGMGLKVVVDHFGRPDPVQGIDDPGFRYLLAHGATRQIWVKLSGAYRNGANGVGEATAMRAAPLLLQAFGPGQLLWGSDWPHTQFEHVGSYDAAWASLQKWVPDDHERATILWDSPMKLYRLSAPPVAAASRLVAPPAAALG